MNYDVGGFIEMLQFMHVFMIFFLQGKISCEKFYLGSTYNRTLILSSIRSRPPKVIWFSYQSSENSLEIHPMRRSYIGKIHFDPRKFCGADCYNGFSMDSPRKQYYNFTTIIFI